MFFFCLFSRWKWNRQSGKREEERVFVIAKFPSGYIECDHKIFIFFTVCTNSSVHLCTPLHVVHAQILAKVRPKSQPSERPWSSPFCPNWQIDWKQGHYKWIQIWPGRNKGGSSYFDRDFPVSRPKTEKGPKLLSNRTKLQVKHWRLKIWKRREEEQEGRARERAECYSDPGSKISSFLVLSLIRI